MAIINDYDDNIESLKANIDYCQENIDECQSSIMQLEEAKVSDCLRIIYYAFKNHFANFASISVLPVANFKM